MMWKSSFVRQVGVGVILLCLGACATPERHSGSADRAVSPDDVFFGTADVPAEVIDSLTPFGAPALEHSTLTLGTHATQARKDGSVDTWSTVTTYRQLGNGLVMRTAQLHDGGENFARLRCFTFRGYMDLVWQSAYLGRSADVPVYAVQRIDELQGEGPSAVFPIRFRIASVTVAAPASEQEARSDCVIAGVGHAHELHESFAGTSRHLRCDLYVGKDRVLRRELAYLDDLGLAIPIENVTATGITRSQIVSASVSR